LPTTDPDHLPNIRARTFDVTITERSKSNRTYMFSYSDAGKARGGEILLLKKGDESIMAFRVLRTYDAKKKFAAKRVKRYGDRQTLDNGESYTAIEKLSDIAPPPLDNQEKADLKELEGKGGVPPVAGGKSAAAPTTGDLPVPPTGDLPGTPDGLPPAPGEKTQGGSADKSFDPDLDSSTSPPPAGAVDSGNSKASAEDLDQGDDDQLNIEVKEILPLDKNSQWLSGVIGYFRANTYVAPGSGNVSSPTYFTGGGVRYGTTLGKQVFLRRQALQDSVVLEAGVYLYRLLNYAPGSIGDAYTVAPLIISLRYNLQFSEQFAMFFYAGIDKSSVIAYANAPTGATDQLNTIFPAGGAGLTFEVGPSWDARADLGYDTFAISLMLRF
jgi:hypothetical protein